MRIRHILHILLAVATFANAPRAALAVPPDAPAEVVSAYVDNQTFLIGRLDAQTLPLTELQQRVSQFLRELIDDPNFHEGVEAGAKQVIGLRDAFVQAGGQEIYVVVSMSDVPYQPPFFVVTSSSPDKLSVLEGMIGQLIGGARPKMEVRKADNRLLIGSETTLARVQALKSEPRPEMVAAWKAASKAPVQLILAPSADHHRVLQEAFPQFPRPWEQLNGQAISDGIQWATLSLNASPKLNAELLVESKNDAAALQLKELAISSLAKLAEFPELKKIVPDAPKLFALIQPQVAGKQVRVNLTEDAKTVEAVMKPLFAAITSARGAAKRAQSTNNLKQIALGMHIYHDKNKHFPAAASYDADGKPLLSWRVHLLPYIDQKALYDLFKLDEAWDSEHNQQAARAIPRQYLDPTLNLKPGMTSYVAPVGEGTVFRGKEGLSLRDIRDGSSNTLMVVATTPENAVFWTKPADLPVAKANPKKGLFSEVDHEFFGALCDGSVRVFRDTIDNDTLWRLFQNNDGKPVDWENIE